MSQQLHSRSSTGPSAGPLNVELPRPLIAVVIPCYRVAVHILDLVARIGPEVELIIAVDDACPEGSGRLLQERSFDSRLRVIFHNANKGVGGAVMTGYQQAIEAGADVIVKLDGDGQMDPALMPALVAPILAGDADYTKGNRFYDLRYISRMPVIRLLGNAALSFLNKFSTGYWHIFDPTNGYTAIARPVAAMLPFDRISERYFFESDMLFRLGTFRAVVIDVPMDAQYGDEVSNLKISRVLGEFAFKHFRNFFKRLLYSYFIRDISIASFELVAGTALLGFGVVFGLLNWAESARAGEATPVGTIMICSIAIVSGLQFLLAFVGYDIGNTPRHALHLLLRWKPRSSASLGEPNAKL